MFMNMFLSKAAKKDTGETRVESVHMGTTYKTDARLCLTLPSLRCPTPNETLVDQAKVPLPVLHYFKALHMRAAFGTLIKLHLQQPVPKATSIPKTA